MLASAYKAAVSMNIAATSVGDGFSIGAPKTTKTTKKTTKV